MNPSVTAAASEAASLATGHAAGYCWAVHSNGRARCTRPPGHDGYHANYYAGRTRPTDALGTVWPQ